MTGLKSYSTTASENVLANTGINWDEGMSPAQVNNSARQNMADMRLQCNDASWFEYGAGSKTVAAVYASSTSVTFTGADATAYWHAGRRVKAVGSGTGTIYGKVASSSYGGGATTVNVTWDSGSLSNEALTIYASVIPVTGKPIHPTCISNSTGTGNVVLATAPTFSTSVAIGGTIIPEALTAAASSSGSNYDLGATSLFVRYILTLVWAGGDGFALVVINSAGSVTTISSANALGNNNAFDTTNNVASNSAQGIALFISGGHVFIQTKNSYNGGAVTLHRFGG